MKIGIPRALLYYRYGVKWQSFFENLDIETKTSGPSSQINLKDGNDLSIDECCLPLKLFLGHVKELSEDCDLILVPRAQQLSKTEEFCMRFWGLPDIVRHCLPHVNVLSYNLSGQVSELGEYLHMAAKLERSFPKAVMAYVRAANAQAEAEELACRHQEAMLNDSRPKILLAGHDYISQDRCIGGPAVSILKELGAVPLFSQHCERELCLKYSKQLSSSLYWTMNKEILGSVALLRDHIDGVIFLSAFPCGTDSLANELALRRLGDLPVTNLLLDGQQGLAGMQTRLECFMDIVESNRQPAANKQPAPWPGKRANIVTEEKNIDEEGESENVS